MALKIASREVDGVVVLALDGRIVLGEETVALRDKVKSLLGEGKKKIVLDLKNVTMIDSSGLGALVIAHTSAKTSGATLRLCNLGSRTNELLQLIRQVDLDHQFAIKITCGLPTIHKLSAQTSSQCLFLLEICRVIRGCSYLPTGTLRRTSR
jgi:anti-sigma B factor antagonist